jgi:glycosyltransferase involved in cell wall biosynthesis
VRGSIASVPEPVVSVVLLTHNRRRLLELALRSVLAQTAVELEAIVVDDASTDDTAAYLDGIADARLRVVRNARSRGVSAARNAGLDAARGKWTAFLDDDDLWAPDKVVAQLAALERAPSARWACVSAVKVDERLRIVGWHRLTDPDNVLPRLLGKNVIPGSASSVLAETALLREIGGFSEGLEASEDWDCWIRLARAAPLAAVDRPLTAYRIAPRTRSHATARESSAIETVRSRHRELAEQVGAEPDREAEIRYLARQELRAGGRLSGARRLLPLGRRRPRYLLWAAAFLVVPRDWELAWTRLREPIIAPGWRRTADWLKPFREAAEPIWHSQPAHRADVSSGFRPGSQ